MTVDRIKSQLVDFQNLGPFSVNIVVGSISEVSKGIATHSIDTFAAAVQNNDRITFLNGTHIPSGAISLSETGLTIRCQSKAATITTDTYTFTSTGANCDIELNVSSLNNVFITGSETVYKLNNKELNVEQQADECVIYWATHGNN